jgi:uncharacterized protein YbaR (Trm112 family)
LTVSSSCSIFSSVADRIFCPLCGPEFGLILLANDVRDRRVMEGDLGCSECRTKYPVRAGFADLRVPPRDSLPGLPGESGSETVDSEITYRLGALLGVTEGPGTLLLEGPEARHAAALGELIDGVEIVTFDPKLSSEAERPSVSRFAVSQTFPFFTATFRGVLLSGDSPRGLLKEATRVLAPKCRLVVLGGQTMSPDDLTALGLTVLLQEEEALVAEKERSGSSPLLTLRGL